MTLADLSSIGSFVSGVAVLASLIFVGIQLRQNTRAVRAAASQAHTSNLQQILNPIIESAEVARLWRIGLLDMNGLTDDEQVRFILLASGCFRLWESARLQWRRGQMDLEHWQPVESTIRNMAGQPGIQTYWRLRGDWHTEEFKIWFDSLRKPAVAHGVYETAPQVTPVAVTEAENASG